MWRRKLSAISWAFLAVMPLSSVSRSGESSRMSSAWAPKRSTIRSAVAGPTPLHTPEDR